MKRTFADLFGTLVLLGVLQATCAGAQSSGGGDPLIARGRYLVGAVSCNACHTPGWRASGGAVPQAKWMTGTNVGYRGPWGTVYPINVRLWFAQIDEKHWLFACRTRDGKPPMPWEAMRGLSERDRRAIYRFVRSLGPAGRPAPADLPPWKTPTTPVIDVALPHRPA